MRTLFILLLSFITSSTSFSQSFKYFSINSIAKEKVNFKFAESNIKDLNKFHTFLEREIGKENVSNIVKHQFSVNKNIKYANFLSYVYESNIKFYNSDLDAIKKMLTTADLSHTINPIKPNILTKRAPVQNCIIAVDETHLLAENVNNCDDCSTDALPLQFIYNFCGSNYNKVYINSNGNISFNNQYFVYNSIGIPNRSTAVMLAPFWADYDIRNCANQRVTYKSEPNRFIITYNKVGHYNNKCEQTNTFQVVLTDGTDDYVGIGNNTAFYYGDMQWTTGDASEGENGFGGTPGTVGINKNDGMSYAVIGRFNREGEAYDGPDGEYDGVDYLDNQCFTFKSEDCNIDNCTISNLQVLLDLNCEEKDNLFTGNYIVDAFTSGGIGSLSIYGDINTTESTILLNADVLNNTISVFVEDSLGCVSSATVTVPECKNPEATCTDGIQNGKETDIDCGGDCPNACEQAWICVNEPGLMQTSNSFVCGGKSIFVREAFSVMDENSVKAYVLHEQKNFDGATYLKMQSSSRFYRPANSHMNKPVYISALIGPAGEDGFPVLNDPCTVWTPYGAYAMFFERVDLKVMDEYCQKGRFFIDVQIKGGVGGVSPNRAYKTVTDGEKIYRNMSPNDIISFGPYSRSGNYYIEALGAKGCKGILNDDYACSGLNRLLNYAANSKIIKLAYLDEGISIENIEIFNLKGQNIASQTSIDQHQAELSIQNEVKGLFVIQVLLSNNEIDFIKILR